MLTDEQRAFVVHPGEVFLEACPGAGKTKAILARASRLAQSLPPRHGVVLLSFTNKAVDELLARIPVECRKSLTFPGFVGTVDSFVRSFLFAPFQSTGPGKRPVVVESWDAAENVAVRLAAPDHFGPGASLDAFDPVSGRVSLQQVDFMMRNHVQANRAKYEVAARSLRARLHRSGRYSAADVRAIGLSRLGPEEFSMALGTALAARFKHVIVDEAQDCNGQDLQLFTWLRRHGVLVTMVGDLDQSIFEFRASSRAEIVVFADTYQARDRMRLTGNFRSAPSVCSLAASLKAGGVPDTALGPLQTSNTPVALCCYAARATAAVGRRFITHAQTLGIDKCSLMVLSHKESVARQVSGAMTVNSGTSRLERLALAVATVHRAAAPHEKVRAAVMAERLLLQLQGLLEDGDTVQSVIDRAGLNRRVLRRQAMDWIARMPPTCSDEGVAQDAWFRLAQDALVGLSLRLPAGTFVRRWLTRPSKNTWGRHLKESTNNQQIAHSTIHSAKGGEYDAVCVVIPPDDPSGRTTELCNAWMNGIDHEAKRVLYVAVTRARRLVAIAIPEAQRAGCEAALSRAAVPYVVID